MVRSGCRAEAQPLIRIGALGVPDGTYAALGQNFTPLWSQRP